MKHYLTLAQIKVAAEKLNARFDTWGNSNSRFSFTLSNNVQVNWEPRLIQRINNQNFFPAYNQDATHVRVEFENYQSFLHDDNNNIVSVSEFISIENLHLFGKGARDSRTAAELALLDALDIEREYTYQNVNEFFASANAL